MLASDIINTALTILGVLAAGETPATEDYTYALAVLNTLLENWNVQGLQIFTITNFQNVLTTAKQAYTMGPNGDFNTTRPVRIERANTLRAGVTRPLRMVDAAGWAAILSRSASDALQTVLYNDNSFDANGCTTLRFWPIPNDGASTADLFVWAQLGDGFALGDTVSFPPGYLKAIQYNLAVDLAPAFGRPLDPTVAQSAALALQQLRAINIAVATETEARPPLQPPPTPVAPPNPQQ